MPGESSEFDFDSGMEAEIAMFKAKRVYKIVSVIQPPFMQWNETTGNKIAKPKSKSKSQIHVPNPNPKSRGKGLGLGLMTI